MTIPSGRKSNIDRLTKIRRRVLPTIHRLNRCFGGYAECTMHPAEYVGTIDQPLPQFHSELRSMEFHREPIAALKRQRDGRESAGSWVRRRSLFAGKQLHITLFENGGRSVDTYAHWEHSWLRHPYKHYQGLGWDTAQGVKKMRALLSKNDVQFRIDRSLQKK